MRIVAGRHRGRLLRVPPGRDLRPTADRMREALFNILVHSAWERADAALAGGRVLDAFAGTGALGLEALSRGAGHVTFIDDDARACRLIERNAAALGEDGRVTVLRRDAVRPGPAPVPCDLAFLDPPYGGGLAAPALAALAANGWLTDGAVVVVEQGRKEALALPAGFAPLKERVHGAGRLRFLVFSISEI